MNHLAMAEERIRFLQTTIVGRDAEIQKLEERLSEMSVLEEFERCNPELLAARARSEWRKAILPLPTGAVLVTDGRTITIAWSRDISKFKRAVAPWMSWRGPMEGVTHWMPLPELPHG